MIDLETSITRSRDFAPGKAVHYRMSPGNVPCVAGVRPDACALADNHVLDFGRRGLQDTLDAVSGASLRAVGGGRDAGEARRPAAVPVPGGGRVVIFSCGHSSHHPDPVEVFGGKLVLYGCGAASTTTRALPAMSGTGVTCGCCTSHRCSRARARQRPLRMAPMQARRPRLHRAPQADARWPGTVMERASSCFGSRADLRTDGLLAPRSGES
jgi:poly-gamma-glutamate capsule biosynthesis protein CapA/YwtB (metallophosphatase superfamily)